MAYINTTLCFPRYYSTIQGASVVSNVAGGSTGNHGPGGRFVAPPLLPALRQSRSKIDGTALSPMSRIPVLDQARAPALASSCFLASAPTPWLWDTNKHSAVMQYKHTIRCSSPSAAASFHGRRQLDDVMLLVILPGNFFWHPLRQRRTWRNSGSGSQVFVHEARCDEYRRALRMNDDPTKLQPVPGAVPSLSHWVGAPERFPDYSHPIIDLWPNLIPQSGGLLRRQIQNTDAIRRLCQQSTAPTHWIGLGGGNLANCEKPVAQP